MTKAPPVATFTKALERAPAILRADKSALGTLPSAAFQYCEALRTASAYGWYVFPPKDISLFYDGTEVLFYDAELEQWEPLKSQTGGAELRAAWNAHAPEALQDFDPPIATELYGTGLVQIWSGYFVQTRADWALRLSAPVNTGQRSAFDCFEAIVETDVFAPAPLFMNLRMKATGREIQLSASHPLFQIQPIPKAAYADAEANAVEIAAPATLETAPPQFWDGVAGTLRHGNPREDTKPVGDYGAKVRRARRG